MFNTINIHHIVSIKAEEVKDLGEGLGHFKVLRITDCYGNTSTINLFCDPTEAASCLNIETSENDTDEVQ